MISAVLFDLGSTLLRFDGQWPDVFAQADAALLAELRAAGINLDGEFTARYRGFMRAYYTQRDSEFVEYTAAYLLGEVLREFGVEHIPDGAAEAALRVMYAVSEAHWHPMSSVHETLAILRDSGYRLGMISNAADDGNVQRLIDNADLRGYFDPILVSAALGIRKPNPRIFDMALEQWGLSPSEAVMVGDTLGADILGARNAGLKSIWVTMQADTPANRAHEDTILPDATAASLAELPELIRNLSD